MLLIPAIDVMDGEAVQLVGGDPSTARRYGDPYEVAMTFVESGARRLHFVDLDAAMERGGGPSGASRKLMESLIAEVRFNATIEIQVGGGIRDDAAAARVMDFADFAVLGTRAVNDPGWLRRVARAFPDRALVAVELRGAQVMTRGWRSASVRLLPEVLGSLTKLPLAGLLHTRLEIEGRRTGLTPELVQDSMDLLAPARLPVVWSGGVAFPKDVEILARHGVAGCIVGSALYDGTFDFREGVARAARAAAATV